MFGGNHAFNVLADSSCSTGKEKMRKIFLRITRGRSHSGNNQVKLAKRPARFGEFQGRPALVAAFSSPAARAKLRAFWIREPRRGIDPPGYPRSQGQDMQEDAGRKVAARVQPLQLEVEPVRKARPRVRILGVAGDLAGPRDSRPGNLMCKGFIINNIPKYSC